NADARQDRAGKKSAEGIPAPIRDAVLPALLTPCHFGFPALSAVLHPVVEPLVDLVVNLLADVVPEIPSRLVLVGLSHCSSLTYAMLASLNMRSSGNSANDSYWSVNCSGAGVPPGNYPVLRHFSVDSVTRANRASLRQNEVPHAPQSLSKWIN